jgi:protein gp37
MSINSKIEWTDATWNPIRGCTKISPGCAHCYAETFAERFRGVAGHPYEQGFDLKLIPEKLAEPLRWPKPKMRDLLNSRLGFAARQPHIWFGVSVENKQHGLPRVEHLRTAPAGLRMLSVEPLLEDLGQLDLTGIGWVILGGESGPKARPLDPDWVRSVRDRCRAADVPFFFKQWGGVRKKEAGRVLDGRTHDDVPARPTSPA